jgi:hypothetical protein
MDTFNSSSRAIGDISTHFCAGVGASRLVYFFAKIDGWAEMNVFFSNVQTLSMGAACDSIYAGRGA